MDDDAFAELYRQHRDVARRVASRRVARHEVEDVVAEAFAGLLAQLVNGREVRDVRSYLLTSVRHESARRSARSRRSEPRADLEPWLEPVMPSDDRALVDALAGLPPRWRQVLWLVEVEGAPPREVAGDLGLSPNAVSALACRARAGLRRAFEESNAA